MKSTMRICPQCEGVTTLLKCPVCHLKTERVNFPPEGQRVSCPLSGGDQWTADEAANSLLHIADDHSACECGNTLRSIAEWLNSVIHRNSTTPEK